MALLVRPRGSGDLRAMRRYTTLASEEENDARVDGEYKLRNGLGDSHIFSPLKGQRAHFKRLGSAGTSSFSNFQVWQWTLL